MSGGGMTESLELRDSAIEGAAARRSRRQLRCGWAVGCGPNPGVSAATGLDTPTFRIIP